MKKLLVLPVLMLLCISAYAQIGVRVGVNFANQNYNTDGISFSPESIIGFQAGLMYEASLTDNIAFRPAILLNIVGSKISLGGILGEIESKFSYITIPLDFVYKLNAGVLSVPIHAGPYLGYLVDVSADGESVDDFDETTNTVDFGINVGAGVELMNNALLLGLNYALGLGDLSKDTDDFKVTNAVFSIIAGYKF